MKPITVLTLEDFAMLRQQLHVSGTTEAHGLAITTGKHPELGDMTLIQGVGNGGVAVLAAR